MKKIIFILSLYIFINNNLVAQAYTPFPENVAVWDIYDQPGPDGPFYPELYHRFTMTGDTIINNISYNKIYYSTYSKMFNAPVNMVKRGYSFAIRQDIPNKKVYRTLAINNTIIDTLLYDYDLKVGDTVPETYTTTHSIPKQIVIAIDSIVFHGKQYRRFKLKDGGTFGAALIEGIGSANGLPEAHFGFFEAAPILKNFCDATSSNCAADLALAIEEPVDNLSVTIFPNPFKTEMNVIFNTEQAERKVILVDVLGNEIQAFNCSGKQLSIQRAELCSGVYFLKIVSKDKLLVKKIIVE